MKKMIMMLVAVFTLGANGTFGQVDDTALASKIVRSQSEMRNYALGLVKSGSRRIGGNFSWFEGQVTDTFATGDYAEDVLKKLFEVQFVYKPVNSNDVINGYLWLYDEQNTLIFQGWAGYKKDVKPKYNIWMQSVPLPIFGVESAEILALDSEGKTANSIALSVNGAGQALYDPYMAGAVNGLLVIRKKGGEVLTFNTSNGIFGFIGEVLEAKAEYGIQGHRIMETVPGATNVLHIIEMWNEPTVFLDVVGAPAVPVVIDVTGIYYDEYGQMAYERPYAMVVQMLSSGQEYEQQLDVSTASVTPFLYGKCRIYFRWKNFGQKPTLYTGPWSGGGKG